MIRILKSWGITADTNCYQVGVIKKSVDPKTGEEKEMLANVRYPTTLQSAIRCILRSEQMELVAKKDMTLQEAIAEFEKLQAKFDKLLAEAVKEVRR